MARAIDSDINNARRNNEPVRKKTSTQRPQQNSGMPTLKLDSSSGLDNDNGHSIPSISMGPVKESDTANRVSMMTGKKVSDNGNRRVVDISEMIPEEVKNRPKETPGVDIYESPQAEILKPGGPFDKYVAEKKEEMIERMAYEDSKRELEKAEAEEDAFLNGTEEEEDPEEKELLEEVNYSRPETLRMNVVTRDDEEEVKNMGEDKANSNVDIAEEEKAIDAEVNSDPTPFYTGTGYKDDYEYADSYDDLDLPTDEEESTSEDKIEDEVFEDAFDEGVVEAAKPEEPKYTVESKLVTPPEEEKKAPVEDNEEDTPHRMSSKKIAFTFDEDSIEDLEKEVENDTDLPTEDERLEELKAEITRKVKPRAQTLNLSGFTVADKATASNKILEIRQASAGKWILPTTGICVEMREISGQKIEYLRENAASNPTASRNALKVLYDHIVSPKPQSFEAWTKSIAYADYDHLYMPIYMAAFSQSNYMPITCVMEQGKLAKKETGCGKMFLTDNIDIMKLVKFKDDESKKKFWNLFDSDRHNSEGLYVSEILPISERFAIKFCEPTLYSVMLEMGSYGREFTTKYENIIAFMPYVADIYWIDAKRRTLVKVDYKKYENNASKTSKSKVIRYSNVFDTLSTDEYTNVVSIINAINEKSDWFTYQIPETTCPECGRTIPAEDITAQGLVFTRHRLGILANTSIK